MEALSGDYAEMGAFIRARVGEVAETAHVTLEVAAHLGLPPRFTAQEVEDDRALAVAFLELAEERGEDLRGTAALWEDHPEFKAGWKP